MITGAFPYDSEKFTHFDQNEANILRNEKIEEKILSSE